MRSALRTVATVALAAMLAACGGAGPSAAGSGSKTPTEVKIGALYSLTGPAAVYGTQAKAALALVEDVVNNGSDVPMLMSKSKGLSNLGGAKIKFVFADSRGEPVAGQSETERLINDEKVAAILGAYHSSVTKTASQAAERAKIPFINPDSVAPTLTERGFEWFFRVSTRSEALDGAYFEFLSDMVKANKTNVKRVGIVYENTEWGSNARKVQEEMAKKYGFELAGSVSYANNATDLSSEVAKVIAMKADAVMQNSYVNDGILFTKTYKSMGYTPQAIFAPGSILAISDFITPLGKDADYVITATEFSLDGADAKPVLKQTNELFKKFSGGKDLDSFTARVVTAGLVVADAINRAGSTDAEAIRKALLATKAPGDQLPVLWDGVEFDQKTHDNIHAKAVLQQTFDGKPRIIWPAKFAKAQPVLPVPAWDKR